MINDDFFKSEIDAILKKRKVKKADRNKHICTMMLHDPCYRDQILDDESKLTAQYLTDKEEEKRIQSERIEQIDFVHWFKCTYPGVRIAAIPNGGKRNAREAAALVLEGVSPGIPDLIIPAWNLWVEMKRVKGGVVSEDQEGWRDYILSIRQHHILANGFEDAKKQITFFNQNLL